MNDQDGLELYPAVRSCPCCGAAISIHHGGWAAEQRLREIAAGALTAGSAEERSAGMARIAAEARCAELAELYGIGERIVFRVMDDADELVLYGVADEYAARTNQTREVVLGLMCSPSYFGAVVRRA